MGPLRHCLNLPSQGALEAGRETPPLAGLRLSPGRANERPRFMAACIIAAEIVMVPMALLVGAKSDASRFLASVSPSGAASAAWGLGAALRNLSPASSSMGRFNAAAFLFLGGGTA